MVSAYGIAHFLESADAVTLALAALLGLMSVASWYVIAGRAIENHARKFKLGVVREFIGHGIGEEFHGVLQIPHYYDSRARTILEEGMTFTIEPMLTLGGSPDWEMWADGWTVVTTDGGRAAQFEHTLLVTPHGVDVLTLYEDEP